MVNATSQYGNMIFSIKVDFFITLIRKAPSEETCKTANVFATITLINWKKVNTLGEWRLLADLFKKMDRGAMRAGLRVRLPE